VTNALAQNDPLMIMTTAKWHDGMTAKWKSYILPAILPSCNPAIR
jgi:hypothetical protein